VDQLLADLVQAMEMAVLERTSPYEFVIRGEAPEFFLRLFWIGRSPEERRRPWAASPELDEFLAKAEPFWRIGCRGVLSSGCWLQTDAQGNEYPVEAAATCLGQRRVLVITHRLRELRLVQGG
jgi:hypothetical protein